MKISKTEEEFVTGQPIDRLMNSKDLRMIIECILSKDLKTARALSESLSKKEELPVKNLGEYLIELVDVLKLQLAGKDLKPIYKPLESIELIEELGGLFLTDEEDVDEIRESIRKSGILVPLICQDKDNSLLLIDGYTRYRLAKELGIKKVPVVVLDQFLGDPKLLSIIINVSRRHMTKEQRDEFIRKLPRPRTGRPKKGDKVTPFSKEGVADLFKISKKTVERARQGGEEAKHKIRLSKYNMTPEEYDILFNKQNGKCALCSNIFKSKYKTVIDHDHISGTIRGLLCQSCNVNIELKDIPNKSKYLKPKDVIEEIEELAGEGFMRHFTNLGYIQSKSFWMNFPFPPTDNDVKDAHRQLDEAIGEVLDFIAKNKIQGEVEKIEFRWSTKIVKREE